ncbi:unnamed protein product, partial [Mesorhabditis spiculigera]
MRRLLLLALLASIADPFSLSDLLDDDGRGEDDEEYFIWLLALVPLIPGALSILVICAVLIWITSSHAKKKRRRHKIMGAPRKEPDSAASTPSRSPDSSRATIRSKIVSEASRRRNQAPRSRNPPRAAMKKPRDTARPPEEVEKKKSSAGEASRAPLPSNQPKRKPFCKDNPTEISGSKEDAQAPPAPPQPLPPPTSTKQTERKPFRQDNRTDLSSSKEDSHHSQKLEIPVTVNTTQASFEPLKRAAGTREKLVGTPVSKNPLPNPPLVAVTPEAVDAPKVEAKIQTPSSPGTIVAQPSTDGFEKKPENLENRPEKLPATVTCESRESRVEISDTPKGSDKTESPSSNVEDHELVNNGSPADTQPEKLPKSTCDTPKAPSSPGSASFMNI